MMICSRWPAGAGCEKLRTETSSVQYIRNGLRQAGDNDDDLSEAFELSYDWHAVAQMKQWA